MKRWMGFPLARVTGMVVAACLVPAAYGQPGGGSYSYQALPPAPFPPTEESYPAPPPLPDSSYDQSYYPAISPQDQVPSYGVGPVPEFGDDDYEYVPPPQPVVSVYLQPALIEPPPIAVAWAPPPMLVEVPPPMPFFGAIWVGGYWAWQGQWIWAAGRWAAPPMVGYLWTQPYYENRNGFVVFIPGYWRAPTAVFLPPPLGMSITVVHPAPGILVGPRPIGPNGCFVPPPPGSRMGLIVPAPLGTAPAVVVGAPPIVHAGMRIRAAEGGRMRIFAPVGVAENGRAVSLLAPAQAHLAAAQRPAVRMMAPVPANRTPIRGFSVREGAARLPPARLVRPQVVRPQWLQRAPQGEMGGRSGYGQGMPQPGGVPQRFRSESAPSPQMQNRAVPQRPRGVPERNAAPQREFAPRTGAAPQRERRVAPVPAPRPAPRPVERGPVRQGGGERRE